MRFVGLAVVVLGVSAFSAMAGNDRKESCNATAGIVEAAVEGRVAGQSAKQVKAALSKPAAGIKDPYTATIDPLVDMVFKMQAQGLGDDTVKAYKANCLKY